MKKIILSTLLLSLLFTELSAVECDGAFMKKVWEDKVLTEIQKDVFVEQMCFHKKIRVTGHVSDVDSFAVTIKDEFGTTYRAYLLHNEVCGRLININKGDKLTIEGIIRKAWYVIDKIFVENAVCIK